MPLPVYQIGELGLLLLSSFDVHSSYDTIAFCLENFPIFLYASHGAMVLKIEALSINLLQVAIVENLIILALYVPVSTFSPVFVVQDVRSANKEPVEISGKRHIHEEVFVFSFSSSTTK